jgi:hypothetical protein
VAHYLEHEEGTNMVATTVIHYKVHPEAAAENERLIKAVLEQLAVSRPPGFHYAVVKLADGVTFAHVITGDRAKAREELGRLPAFQAFSQGSQQRWAEGSAPAEAAVIGAFGD